MWFFENTSPLGTTIGLDYKKKLISKSRTIQLSTLEESVLAIFMCYMLKNL